MKKILISLFCLLLPMIMLASAQEEASQPGGSTQIMVNANREAEFHYPQKAEFPYLSAAVKVGEIGLSDLFLQEDESLLITAETVPLALQNGEAPQSSISFDVTAESLELAVVRDGSWNVTVSIAEQDWKKAAEGDYAGVIKWTVTSSLTHEVLFQEETRLYTAVPPKDDGGNDNPPETGDGTLMLLYSLLAGLSALTLLVLLYIKYRNLTQECPSRK